MVPDCKPEWNREATTVFSRLPSLMAADKPCPLLQPSLPGSPLVAIAPPDFGRSLSQPESDYAHHITTAPPLPDFQTFLQL